ncbi:helix-turn-helix domain-containing protein [Algoriphagus limi]|uniref:Helix-turn-helix domain-containing protein n=1 Tax=Algoriphagus limi TaxID=2975273 RepID=A0ABT2G7E7_9BACT|nr:helix-turn-helix domain-containing protein [Algoriphagus limi]MCS5491192.1 helix-turn-helix domain-containing protein [Algoriphagus limi]
MKNFSPQKFSRKGFVNAFIILMSFQLLIIVLVSLLIADAISFFETWVFFRNSSVGVFFLFLIVRSEYLRFSSLPAFLQNGLSIQFQDLKYEFGDFPLETPELFKNFNSLTQSEKLKWISICTYLEYEQPYLIQDFTVKKMENELNIPSRTIAGLVKKLLEMNFNAFINHLRIEFVIRKLYKEVIWRSYTVESLAYSAGYNSPNSFYNYFKEYTGTTPREFISELGIVATDEMEK